ncbi:MAG: helix-turn-helix transcriptional regulator [Bacilli bacterium]|nr:helix-turn-helix transcriptional regulator [Bacilli bacterium]
MDRENIKKGSFLKLLRTSNHMSERDLAEILDVEPSDITVWETGIKFPEDSATIDKLAKIFHVTKREITNGEYRKDKVTEVEYKEKKIVDEEDNLLSNTGKNILIVVLSCVILLIIFISIISLTTTVNKKVNINPADYYVSDEREEIIHTPKSVSETVVRNTVALSQKKTYNPDVLLNYGFNKNGNVYSKSYGEYKIVYKDDVFTLTFYYKGYKEVYEKRVDSSYQKTYIYDTDYKSEYNEQVEPGIIDCTSSLCRYTNDYLKYVNFLSDKVRE